MKMPKNIKELPFGKYDGEGNDCVRYKIDVSQISIGHERMYLIECTANPKYEIYHFRLGYYTHLNSFRVLVSKKSREYRIYEDGKQKVTECAIGKCLNSFGYYDINEKSEKLLKRLCGSKSTGNHEVDNLISLLDKWHEVKKAETRKKNGYIDDDAVYSCPEEYPEGFLDWVRREIIDKDQTIVYKKGNIRGTCSVCGEYVTTNSLAKFRQYQHQLCPNCGTSCLCVLEDSSAWLADNVKNVAAMQRGSDGTVWFRQWHVRRDNDARYENLESYLDEAGRYAVRGEKSAAWTHYYKENSIYAATERKYSCWERYNTSDVYDGSYEFYCGDIKSVIAGTSLEYSSLENYINNDGLTMKNPIKYCWNFVKYPVYEFLYKRGFYTIIKENTRGYGLGTAAHAIGWQKKKLKECFKFPIRYLNLAEPQTWTMNDIFEVNKLYAAKIPEAVIKRSLINHIPADYIIEARENASVQKVLTYLEKQKKLAPEESFIRLLGTYNDYIRECQQLNFDMKSKSVLFPQNLTAAHANNQGVIRAQKNKEYEEKFKKAVAKFKKSGYSKNGLTIQAAKSMEELVREGEMLHHCVGGYIRRVADGECMIFFVRQADKPEQPYYTLELRNKKIIQCRTLNNESYESNEEVKIFVDGWLKKINKGA